MDRLLFVTYPHPQQDPWADSATAHPPPPPAHLPPTKAFEQSPEHYPSTPTSPAQPHPSAPQYQPAPQYPPVSQHPPAPHYPPAPHSPAAPHYPVVQYHPGAPPNPYAQPQPPQSSPQVLVVPVLPAKSAGTAVALELLPGLIGIFGIGNIYAGRIGVGIALMVSFWVLFWINVALFVIGIGFVTLPLTWLLYMVVGALLAAGAVGRHGIGPVGR